MQEFIPFNKPYMCGNELQLISDAVSRGKLSGDGYYTKLCHQWFEGHYHFNKCLLTTSCTDALEMAAILAHIAPGDEVIVPAFTFVSTVNAFVLRGAKIVFADSRADQPNVDETKIEALITPATKAIVVVHYAGVACHMDVIMDIAVRHSLLVVEDAAQCFDAYYKNRPLGGIGHLAAFSFHETKNIISGEGGMLVINDKTYEARAEIIREKGTNRSAFFRGEIAKYGWVDIGSSFLPSELIAAYLYAQLLVANDIQSKRKAIWQQYFNGLKPLCDAGYLQFPFIPDYATNNAHMFYIICHSLAERSALIAHLKKHNILAVFHYLSLHKSPYYNDKYIGTPLPQSDRYSDCLVRLPFYYELTSSQLNYITDCITHFYKKNAT